MAERKPKAPMVGSMTPSPRFQRMVAEQARAIEERNARERAAAAAELAERQRRLKASGGDPGTGTPSISKRQHFTPRQDAEYRRFRARPAKGDRRA